MKRLWIALVATIIASLGTASVTNAAVITTGEGHTGERCNLNDYYCMYGKNERLCKTGQFCIFEHELFQGRALKLFRDGDSFRVNGVAKNCVELGKNELNFKRKASSIINKTGRDVVVNVSSNCSGSLYSTTFNTWSFRIEKNAVIATLKAKPYWKLPKKSSSSLNDVISSFETFANFSKRLGW